MGDMRIEKELGLFCVACRPVIRWRQFRRVCHPL